MKTYLIAAAFTLILLAILLPFATPISRLESEALDVKFILRGERSLDSNIVIIYLNEADIAALGGWPVKRSYYALIVTALHELGVKVIGFDILLKDPVPLYAEFDSLLVSVASKSGNVVFPSYFQILTEGGNSETGEESPGNPFAYTLDKEVSLLKGRNLHLPFPALLHSAASIGHANLSNETGATKIPLFVESDNKAIPSLAFEMARLYRGDDRGSVAVHKGRVTIGVGSKQLTIPTSEKGYLYLNHRGGLSSLNLYRFIEFLQSYDTYRSGLQPRLPVERLGGKVVLIGIIAPGFGRFVDTPYEENFPGIGIHATVLDNLLTGDCLTVSPRGVQQLISWVLAFGIFLLILHKQELIGFLSAAGLLALYLVLNFAIFLIFSISLPAIQPLLMGLVALSGGLAFRHVRVKRELLLAESDKDLVEKLLRQKESKLMELESELHRMQQKAQQKSATLLQEEIKQYREDIKSLSARVADFSAYVPPEEDQGLRRENFEGLIYTPSGRMGKIIDLVKKIAPSDANVFITGESGTGKELIARAIHNRSERAEKPFVALNCGALTESLLESELFGHERGAFTGAVREKPGRFELAEGGTIFLDEITETSEAFQVKLLRVVQSGEFERVGGTSTLKVNVRVVAATNKDVKEEIEKKRFREDLYYRLSVFTLELPPLRERKSDIPFLVDHFLKAEGEGLKLSSTVMDAFLRYNWKGNVRELESVIKRAAILAKADSREMIRIRDIPEEVAACLQKSEDLEVQILLLLREKRFSRNAISETAEDLGGLNRGTVAEYFRGLAFKTYVEQEYNLQRAASVLAGSPDPELAARVNKKLREYLANVFDGVDPSKPLEEIKATLLPKYKNLPHRYHFFLDQLIEAYRRGIWSIPPEG